MPSSNRVKDVLGSAMISPSTEKLRNNTMKELNSQKCIVKAKSTPFFGKLYTDKGVFLDPQEDNK